MVTGERATTGATAATGFAETAGTLTTAGVAVEAAAGVLLPEFAGLLEVLWQPASKAQPRLKNAIDKGVGRME